MREVILHLQTRMGSQPIVVAGTRFTIGSDEEADLRPDDSGLAWLQATIYREGEKVWIVDEAGDSLVNHQAIPARGAPLADGDEIRLGEQTRLLVEIKQVMPRPIKRQRIAQIPTTEPAREQQKRTPISAPLITAMSLLALLMLGLGIYAMQNGKVERRITEARKSPTLAASVTPQPSLRPTIWKQPPPTLYRQMTPEEQRQFVNDKVIEIAYRMSSSMRGEKPNDLPLVALDRIKQWVGNYARRDEGNCTPPDPGTDCAAWEAAIKTKCGWGTSLRSLYKRATCVAPLIYHNFDKRNISELIGLYLVMVESEYREECRDNGYRVMGMFQFLDKTAKGYGLRSEERCDEKKMAEAAAHYMSDRIAEFGTDWTAIPLAIAGYNRGPGAVQNDVRLVMSIKEARENRTFWNLILNSHLLDHWFNKENIHYVPKFFAAAVIGENPQYFGLEMKQLSSYRDGRILRDLGLGN